MSEQIVHCELCGAEPSVNIYDNFYIIECPSCEIKVSSQDLDKASKRWLNYQLKLKQAIRFKDFTIPGHEMLEIMVLNPWKLYQCMNVNGKVLSGYFFFDRDSGTVKHCKYIEKLSKLGEDINVYQDVLWPTFGSEKELQLNQWKEVGGGYTHAQLIES